MEFKNWKNQYIGLIKTKPNCILSFNEEKVTESDVAVVRQKLSEFPRAYCEIGFGSGQHLVELGRRNPNTLCCGFEIRFKRVYKTAEKGERAGLKNLLLFRLRAQEIGKLFQPQSLDGIFINFPDPWDKPKWFKHRLLNDAFLSELAGILKPGGFLSYKTDHGEYFEQALDSIRRIDAFRLTRLTRDMLQSSYIEDNIPTEFEGLFRSQGLPIHFLFVEKESSL